jgi:hypothetical protein
MSRRTIKVQRSPNTSTAALIGHPDRGSFASPIVLAITTARQYPSRKAVANHKRKGHVRPANFLTQDISSASTVRRTMSRRVASANAPKMRSKSGAAMRLRGVCAGRHRSLLMRAAFLVVFVASAAAAALVRLAGWLP